MSRKISFSKIPFESKDSFKEQLLSYLNGIASLNPGKEKHTDYSYFDFYWEEPERIPAYIFSENQCAGFFLVKQADDPEPSILAEFCIFSEYRKKGIGKAAAMNIFHEFGTSWEVNSRIFNAGATLFWENVIADYTGGQFKKIRVKNEYYDGYQFQFDRTQRSV
ncbi:MAG: GNAT family N-acetyltransferase [Spirochaetia bacterium]|nr:GNAT family N-acetyltransferase [Spirochaetia bacterium]